MGDNSQNAGSSAAKPQPAKKKSFIKTLAKVILFCFTGLFLLLLFLFIFIQTPWFNRILLNTTVREINDSWKTKQSILYAEDIEGNIFSGLTVTHGNITMRGDTLMNFGSINVKYDLWRFLQREIMIKEAIINEPEVNITNVKGLGDSLIWNIEFLFSPKEKKTDTTAFDWDVSIKDLIIHNGMIRILGFKPETSDIRRIKMERARQFDINNLDVFNLEMELEAEYFIASKTLKMKSMSFNTNSDFNLKALTFEANITDKDTVTQVKNLVFKTDRSELYADNIFMNRLNPFKRVIYEEFGNDNVKINLHTSRFDFKDLKFFLPQLNFLDSTVALDMEASGMYKSVNITKLNLTLPNSKINLSGRVDHLDDPSKLFIDVTARDLAIDPADTRRVLPGLPIPDYSQVGKVYANFKYVGEPLNFATDFDVKSDAAGSARGTLKLDLNTPGYFYDSRFEASSVNIGRIIKNKKLESSLNMRADITGTGFDPNNLSSRINYEMNSSRIYGMNISRSTGSLNIRSKNIEGEITFVSDALQTAAKGSVNVSNISDPKYSVKGYVRDLNLAQFTKSSSDKSDLDFTFDVNGRGVNLDNIDGVYHFDVTESYYGKYHILPTPVNLKINNSKTNGSVDLTTNMFDFRAKGNFNLGEISDVIASNIRIVTDEIENKFAYDSLGYAYTTHHSPSPHHAGNFDFEYEFVTKDIKSLSSIFEVSGYRFNGRLSGRLQNSNNEFLSLSDISFKDISLKDSVFAARDLAGTILFRNDYQKTIPFNETGFYAISSDVNLHADSLRIGNTYLDSGNINLKVADATEHFRIFGKRDTSYIVLADGSMHLANEIQFNIDSLSARYHEHEVHNDGKLVLAYDTRPSENTIKFEQFNVTGTALRLSAEGKLSLKGNSDLVINSKNIKVAEVIEYLYPQGPQEPAYVSPVIGNIRRLQITYTGTLDDPVINLEMNSDLLRYQTAKIGRFDAFIDYKNEILTSDVLLSSAQGNGKMRLTGDIPFANPLSAKDTSGFTAISNYPVDFKLSAKDFQANFFSRLIPNFTEVRALINGEITTTGTVSQPVLAGYMNLTKGRFFLPLTGIYYNFNTSLKTENSNLVVEKFQVFNVGNDRRHLDASGSINFEGLKINDIDLSFYGDIAMVDNTADYNDLGVYGTIIAGVGTPSVTLRGNLEELRLEGQFLIKEANITSVSFRGTAYDIYNDNFVYRNASDTAIAKLTYLTPEQYYEIEPFERRKYRIGAEYLKKGTNLALNLNIATQKNLLVSISFGSLPKQDFVGEIKANLDLYTNKDHQVRAFGNVNVVGDSYYRLYRNFKIYDSHLTFTGPFENPEIAFHAAYENQPSTSAGASAKVKVVVDVTGTSDKPDFSMRLYENDNEVSGSEAQSEALSYLIFGVPRSQLLPSQRNSLARNIGTTTGTTYLSSVLSEALRSIAPFVINTEVSYTEGNILQGTDVRITSAFGDAIVKVGGRVFSDLNNTEISIQYPLNKLFKMGIANNLMLEISRTADLTNNFSVDIRTISTGAKILYIIRY